MKPDLLERDVSALTAEIAQHDSAAAEAREKADQLVSTFQEKGVNPATDADAFAEVDAAYKVSDEHAQAAASGRERQQRMMEIVGRRPADPRTAVSPASSQQSLAEEILAMPQFKGIAAGQINAASDEILTRDEALARMRRGGLFAAGADLDGTIDIDQRRFPPVATPVRQIRLFDVLNMQGTNSDLVVYVRQTTRTSAAAAKALGDPYDEATYEWEEVPAPVSDIGHWTRAHRSQIADAPQFQGVIETQLEEDVKLGVEDMVLNGSGTPPELEGILTNSDVDGNAVTRDTTDERRIEAIHRGITKVRVTGFIEPDTVVLHPNDYEETLFEGELSDSGLAKGNYLLPGVLGGVAGGAPMTIWGKTVVVTPVIPEGTGLVGNFRLGATLWVRSGVSIRISDSHDDLFIRRQVAILAEMRAAFGVQRSFAFSPVEAL